MKIAILDDYADAFRSLGVHARLAGHEVVVFRHTEKDPAALAKLLDGFDAVVLTMQRSPIPRAVVERLRTVRLLSQTGRNAGHIDVAACTERGIAVAAGAPAGADPAAGAAATAELAWALILAAMRNLPHEIERLKAGEFQTSVGRKLYGKTLGIYAFGRLGKVVAGYGRAFGMRVQCWGREGSLERARAAGFEVAPDRGSFFETSDVLSLHLPLNKETAGIVTAADLARMKPSALLVNTSRAGIVAPGALEQALQQGRPGKAAVDVYEDEPVLGGAHPLLHVANAVCTPHLGYVEDDSLSALLHGAVDQILAYASGTPLNVVNPEVLGP
jgi:D-3-phosphoglycerate dehydrogenase